MTRRTASLPAAVILITLAATVSGLAAPPPLIRYQARLTDDAGVPLTGSHQISFAVYDAGSGGNELWSEGPRSVTLSNGVLDILMGEVVSIPSSVFALPDRWLEVTVGGTQLAPRQRLSSVPYAHDADRLAGNDAAFFLDTSSTGQTKQGPLTLQGELRLDGDGDGQNDTQFLDGPGEVNLNKYSSGNAFIDLNPRPANGSDARVRLFRNTNTSGPKFVSFQRGNNTTIEDARIGVDGVDSFFQMNGGNVGIGTSSPGAKLEVVGDVAASGTLLASSVSKDGRGPNVSSAVQMQGATNQDDIWINFRYGGSAPNGRAGTIFSRFSTSHYFVHNDLDSLTVTYSAEDTDSPDVDLSTPLLTVQPDGDLQVSGLARAERVEVTTQLGSASTPEVGALYRDNLIKAWASTDATGTLLDGFNLIVTQTGTGTYTYTFRRAMATAVYAVVATNTAAPLAHAKVGSKTTTGFVVITQNASGGLVDREHDVIVVGN